MTPKAAAVYIDRDLGWLEFNRRVLAEACDARTPLLERAKFLAIFSANLDEFFMKRMALLRDQADGRRHPLLPELRSRIINLVEQRAHALYGHLVPDLAAQGIHLQSWDSLTPPQRAEAGAYFDSQVSAALTPLVIHPSQPFPFFSNLSVSLTFALHDGRTTETADARVKVPAELPQWVSITVDVPPGARTFVRLHEVIRENAFKLYPGMRLTDPTLFRVTRDAEVELDADGDEAVQDVVREQIRQRRFEPVVRLELAAGAHPRVQQMLVDRFELTLDDVYTADGELDYSSLFQIANLDVPSLRDAPWVPLTPARLADEDIFATIRAGDVLLHHPYDSFDASVERFINAAATDSDTLAIKMTVYRVGDDTPFVRSLISAAEAGKQVACVIELKARFDEARNLHWATELGRAGAHVSVGDLQLKTHAKVALVVRREAEGLRSYAHLGTGNYHVKTARLYTDVGLLTCDPAITTDVVNLFHHLTGRSEQPDFPTLLVAPRTMRREFLGRIDGEIAQQARGRPARIIAQMNQLDDTEMMEALCKASCAGVPVDLIVRGFCCLPPGVPGASERIRIRSIIGRFLEHARIFHFAAGEADPVAGEFLIGSADWMHRNLSRRIETVTPVLAQASRAQLWDILSAALRDTRQSWVMHADGSYTQLHPAGPDQEQGVHTLMMDRARLRAHER